LAPPHDENRTGHAQDDKKTGSKKKELGTLEKWERTKSGEQVAISAVL